MVRLSALFVAICILLIATSFGVLLYLTVGFSGAEAVIASVAALTGLATYNTVSVRAGVHSGLSRQITDLAHGTADLARQVGEHGRRLVEMEKEGEIVAARALAAVQPIQTQMSELGALLSQLAQTVASLEIASRATPVRERHRLAPAAASAGLEAKPETRSDARPETPGEGQVWKPILRPGVPSELPAVAPESLDPLPANTLTPQPHAQLHAQPHAGSEPSHAGPAGEAQPAPPPAAGSAASSVEGPFRGLPRTEIISLVGHAVGHNRVELYLQPVVTLPQRKVRHYEALLRLRMPDDRIVTAADFLPFAEAGGLMAELDRFTLTRGVRIVRRLQSKNRDVGVFCNLSAATLSDPEAFARFVEIAEANRAVAPLLMFEMAYPVLRSLGAGESANLAALTNLGYRLSVDHVADLRFDAAELATHRVKYLKVSAATMLNKSYQATAKIHLADLAGYLTRFGIDLIAEKVESEAQVVDLFDFDLKFGQGILFSPPRPIRPESMAEPERTDAAPAVATAPASASSPAPAVSPAPPPPVPVPVVRSTADRPTVLSQIARAVARQQGGSAA